MSDQASTLTRYQPYYCEENIWHLCQSPRPGRGRRWVVFISNTSRRCLLLDQRAGGERGEVLWDYHVVLLVEPTPGRCVVWDLDSRGGAPQPLTRWLSATFGHVGSTPVVYDPMFRVIAATRFVESFASDRRHMRDEAGWRAPPPPWAPIGAGFTLWEHVSMAPSSAPGEIVDLAALQARFVGGQRR